MWLFCLFWLNNDMIRIGLLDLNLQRGLFLSVVLYDARSTCRNVRIIGIENHPVL